MPATVPACARTMAVFEVFAREKRELSNSDLARLLDLPDSSCSDLIHTLHQIGYVVRTARTRRFYPSSRLFATAKEIIKNDPLFIAGSEAIELLSEKTGETTFCGLLDDGAAKIIAVHEGRYPLRYILKAGDRIALHVSALGKALLGILPADEAPRQLRLKPLRQITVGTITDPGQLEHQIAAQRARNWYCSDEEGSEGVMAFAVSGLIGDQPVAISLAGPTERMRRNHDCYLVALEQVRILTFTEDAIDPMAQGAQ
jgi:DNA-binding IclR family transcriptional regulator